MQRVRNYIFLKEVFWLSITAFGGPQAHMAMFLKRLVAKRNYLSEKDLLELQALCQILPGPTSTQTITAIGYQIGGAKLAYLTLLVWALPAVTFMTMAGVLFNYLADMSADLRFTRFIQPMAVGIVAYSALTIGRKVVTTKTGFILMILSAIISFMANTPYAFPIILVLAGLFTTHRYKKQEVIVEKKKLKVDWRNFLLWAGVLVIAAIVGALTRKHPELLPFRLFENFYRNGSLIFGGGQVLIPMLYTEFVEFKHYLTSAEFLSGYSLVQSLPGPVFSFSSFIGSLSMRQMGLPGEFIGGIVAAIGIFLPGTFLIFFVIKFWDSLKQYRWVRASLEGVHAASSGMVIAATALLFIPLDNNALNISVVIITFLLITFTKIPTPLLILAGLLLGFIV